MLLKTIWIKDVVILAPPIKTQAEAWHCLKHLRQTAVYSSTMRETKVSCYCGSCNEILQRRATKMCFHAIVLKCVLFKIIFPPCHLSAREVMEGKIKKIKKHVVGLFKESAAEKSQVIL